MTKKPEPRKVDTVDSADDDYDALIQRAIKGGATVEQAELIHDLYGVTDA
jgi:hypothetical protein